MNNHWNIRCNNRHTRARNSRSSRACSHSNQPLDTPRQDDNLPAAHGNDASADAIDDDRGESGHDGRGARRRRWTDGESVPSQEGRRRRRRAG